MSAVAATAAAGLRRCEWFTSLPDWLIQEERRRWKLISYLTQGAIDQLATIPETDRISPFCHSRSAKKKSRSPFPSFLSLSLQLLSKVNIWCDHMQKVGGEEKTEWQERRNGHYFWFLPFEWVDVQCRSSATHRKFTIHQLPVWERAFVIYLNSQARY